MADIEKIKGGVNRPDDPNKSKKEKVDSQAFKDLMKVKETDPEEQRKRKRQDEAEEEKKADQIAGGPVVESHSLEDAPSPFTKDTGASAPSYTSSNPLNSNLATSSAIESSDSFDPIDTDLSDIDLLAPSSSYSSLDHLPSQPTSQSNNLSPKSPDASPVTSAKTVAKKGETTEKKNSPKASTTRSRKEIISSQEDTSAPKAKRAAAKKKEIENLSEASQATQAPTPFPLTPIEKTEKTEKTIQTETNTARVSSKKSKTTTIETKGQAGQVPLGSDPFQTPQERTTTPLISALRALSPDMIRLVEKVGSILTVMHLSSVTETTLSLDTPQFAHSSLYGMQIIIKEFSTAPKEFNIEFVGSQKGLDLVAQNQTSLMAAFQSHNHHFKVHRIDTSLLSSLEERKLKRARVQKSSGRDL